MPETPANKCPYLPACPVYRLWNLFSPDRRTLWDVIQSLDEERQHQLAMRLEESEPIRSTIELLTKENAALRAYKRRAELFLLSKGLSLPED